MSLYKCELVTVLAFKFKELIINFVFLVNYRSKPRYSEKNLNPVTLERGPLMVSLIPQKIS
jgi:sensor domain CHASE-containing protein